TADRYSSLATTSNAFCDPLGIVTVSPCRPPNEEGRPFTVTAVVRLVFGTRNFTCTSFGARGAGNSTVATTAFLAASDCILKFTRPQRVGAWRMLISLPDATQLRGNPVPKYR